MMIRFPIFRFIACAVSACSFAAVEAVTVTTSPVGVYSVDCPGESDTFISVPVFRDAAFTGKVQSVSTTEGITTVIVDGEPNFTANRFVYGAGGGTDHFYVKFSSGLLEGAWYNVEANGAYSIQIEIGAAEAAKIAEGDSFLVIPHWTLNTLMPQGAGIVASTSKPITTRSQVMFFEDGKEGTNQTFSRAYYFYKTANEEGWADSLNISNKYGHDDVVIYPDTFLVVRNNNVPAGTTLTFSGNVHLSRGSIVLANLSGSLRQDNFIALPTCTKVKLSDLNHCFSGDFFKPSVRPNLSAGGDELLVYSKEVKKNKLPSEVYYFNGTNWYKSGSVICNDVEIDSTMPIVIRRTARGEAIAHRACFTPTYLQ